MTTPKIEISNYTVSDHSELLRLLLELQSTYFHQSASLQNQELRRDKDPARAYENYLTFIENNKDDAWQILLAKTETNSMAGFIIGSIVADEELVLSKIGKIEDWFVVPSFRGQGIGSRLYQELENWFVEQGCKQVSSDTWEGNQLSIKAHWQLGFFVSGITFSKKL